MKNEKNKSSERARDLKRLARVLTSKADIYVYRGRRIYGFEAAFAVIGDELFHGTTKLDPAALIDGHGRFIANVSNF